MSFNLKKHIMDYMDHGDSKAKRAGGGCVARIDEGNDQAHEELMKIKSVLKGYMQDLPEGYEMHVLGCCDGTAQDQVIFVLGREMSYRDKASFAVFDDYTRIEHITRQAPYLKFTLSPKCSTLLAVIDVPAGHKTEKEIPFSDDYEGVVSDLVKKYAGIIFPVD